MKKAVSWLLLFLLVFAAPAQASMFMRNCALEQSLYRENHPCSHNGDYGVTAQTSGDHGLYQPMLYTHSELDAETGYYHNKARHYAPKFGKFLARDPIASNNLYSYCGGDPINSEDPSGLQPPVTNLGVVPFGCDFSKPQTPQQKEGAAFATQQVAFYLVGGAVMRGIGYAGRAVFGSAPMVAAGTAGPTIASETAQAAISRTVFGSIMRRLGVVAVTDTGLETAGVYYGGNFFILGRLGLFSEGQAIIVTLVHKGQGLRPHFELSQSFRVWRVVMEG